MSNDRDLSHDSTSASRSAADHAGHDPGRASRTALMRKPDQPIVSGLLARKGRNANGVAEGAENAVAAASSSSGSPLPDTLMRKFESSLGADLSGVRVHTGSESAAANDAVGARAYTMGNDIHFGAGQYDPSSSSGEHLIAHEVAHTVQQSGGASRVQFKLDVSAPGDAHEVEADRAADEMVSGRAAQVTTGAEVQRKAFRKPPEPNSSKVPAKPDGETSGPAQLKQMLATVTATENSIIAVRNRVNDFAADARTSLTDGSGTLNHLAAIESVAFTKFANALSDAKLKADKEHDEAVKSGVGFVVGLALMPLDTAVEHLTQSKLLTKLIMSQVESAIASKIEHGVSDATKPKLPDHLKITAAQFDPLVQTTAVGTRLMRALTGVSELQDLRPLEGKPLSSLAMQLQALADGKTEALDGKAVTLEKCQAQVGALSSTTASCAQTTSAVAASESKIRKACTALAAQKALHTPKEAEQRYWLRWLQTLGPAEKKAAFLDKTLLKHMVAAGVNHNEPVDVQQLALQTLGKIAKVTRPITAGSPGKATVDGVAFTGEKYEFSARAYSPGGGASEKAVGTYGTVLSVDGGVLVLEAAAPEGFIGECEIPKPKPWAPSVE